MTSSLVFFSFKNRVSISLLCTSHSASVSFLVFPMFKRYVAVVFSVYKIKTGILVNLKQQSCTILGKIKGDVLIRRRVLAGRTLGRALANWQQQRFKSREMDGK